MLAHAKKKYIFITYIKYFFRDGHAKCRPSHLKFVNIYLQLAGPE